MFQEAEQQGQQVYGLTRGVGHGRRTIISGSARPELSERLLSYGENHTDQPYSPIVGRGALLLRSRSLASGSSGVSPVILKAMISWFNDGVEPMLYRSGSIGAADLGEMGQLARCLLGQEGSQVVRRGQLFAASEFCELSREELSSRDPLGLVSANSVTLAEALLLLGEVTEAFDFSLKVFAESLVAFSGNPSPFSPEVMQGRANRCEREASGRIYELYFDAPSRREPRDVQDPLSFRCAGQVAGALLQSITNTRDRLEERINSSDDNPTVAGEEILSTANFDTTLLAAAFDELRVSLIRSGLLASERINKLSWPEFNDAAGAPSGTTYSGMALAGKLRGMAYPASIAFAGQPSRGVEDWASLLPQAVSDCRRALEVTCSVLRLEGAAAAGIMGSQPLAPSGELFSERWLQDFS